MRWSHEHTRLLMDAFGVKTLWDDHGVISDILVSPFILQNKLVLIVLAAVYSILSTCRYSRTHGAGPTPSNHQGYLQRPPCRVGWRVSDCYAWQFSCSSNNDIDRRWEYLKTLLCNYTDWRNTSALRLSPYSLDYADFLKVADSNSGPAMTRKHLWRYVQLHCLSNFASI